MSFRYHDQVIAGSPAVVFIPTSNSSIWDGYDHTLAAGSYTQMFSNLAPGVYFISVNAPTVLNNSGNTNPIVLMSGNSSSAYTLASLGTSGGTALIRLQQTTSIYMYCNIESGSQTFNQMMTFAIKLG